MHNKNRRITVMPFLLLILLCWIRPAVADDIIETAAKNPELSRFVAALRAADLAKTLKGPGPFTVFAPSNAAFAKMPDSVLNALMLPKNRSKLVAILGYHVVPGGKFLAAEATADSIGSPSPPTLQGGTITLTALKPFAVNNVRVSTTDIQADNGVIHIVDSVLLPPNLKVPTDSDTTVATVKPTDTKPVEAKPTPPLQKPNPEALRTDTPKPVAKTYKNAYELAQSNPRLSTFVAAVKAAGLVETLQGAGPFTILVPTNAAFDKLPAGLLDTLLKPENKTKLVELLKYHAFGDKYLASDVIGSVTEGSPSPPTLQGDSITLTSTAPLKLNDANVVRTDLIVDNGVVDILDKVLLPPGFMKRLQPDTVAEQPVVKPVEQPTVQPVVKPSDDTAKPVEKATEQPVAKPITALPAVDQDIIEVASADPDLSTFVMVVEKAGLTGTLKRRGPYTVFAPNNAAFKKLKKEELAELMSLEGAPKLSAILTYHIVVGQKAAADLSDGQLLKTANSAAALKIGVGSAVKAGNATVIKADIPAKNGVVHIVDSIIMPPKEALPKPPPSTFDQ